jgi:protein-S-isoprenylcysteine O-methyltransferase Ste14
MVRSTFALAAVLVFAAVGFGWRTVVQVRRHGDTGWRFQRSGLDRVVAPALALSLLLLGAAPVLALVAGEPWRPAGVEALATGTLGTVAGLVGAALAVAGGVITVVAQLQMGASWRIGVEPGERTELVTQGLFAHVRNPIFTGMLAVAVGTALLVPNLPAILGATSALVTICVQVRLVEEPNLRRVHGASYLRWASRTGRFLPGLGRLAA